MNEQPGLGPKTPEDQGDISSQALFDFLGVGDSPEDRQEIEDSLRSLREELKAVPKVGRMFEENKPGREELVIPVTSKEQEARLLTCLYNLSVFPWEEEGLLIIDRKQDLEKLRLAGISAEALRVEQPAPSEPGVVVAPVPVEEAALAPSAPIEQTVPKEPRSPISLGADLEEKKYGFTLPRLPQHEKRKNKEEKKARAPYEMEQDEPIGIDRDLLDIVRKFDSGEVDDDTPEFERRVGFMPSLSLFPHKYVWDKRKLYRRRTQELISAEEQKALLERAKGGDVRAMNEYIRMNVGMVIYIARALNERYGGDVDELFQGGLMGLDYAIRHNDAERTEEEFTAYMVKCIEGYARRQLDISRSIHLPEHTVGKRRQIHRDANAEQKKKQLLGPKYGEEEDIVNEQRIERLRLRLLIGTRFDPIDGHFDEENWEVHEKLMMNPLQEDAASERELQKRVSAVFSSLTPREERVLRLRFGFGDLSHVPIPGLEPGERTSDTNYADGYSLEEIAQMFGVTRERIRQIEAKTLRKLKHPSRARKLRPFLYPLGDVSDYVSATFQEKAAAERRKMEEAKGFADPNFQAISTLAERFNVGAPEIRAAVRALNKNFPELLQEHPDWIQLHRDPDNRWVEYLHIDLIPEIEEQLKSPPSRGPLRWERETYIPADWPHASGLAKELEVSVESVREAASVLRMKGEDEVLVGKDIWGKPLEFYTPVLAGRIRARLHPPAFAREPSDEQFMPRPDKVPEDWERLEDISEDLGMQKVDVLLLALSYRSSHPGWFRGEYFHPELAEKIRESANEERKRA